LERLEPYDGKLSRAVLRGVSCGNTACLLGAYLSESYCRKKQKILSAYVQTQINLIILLGKFLNQDPLERAPEMGQRTIHTFVRI
nr:hypothetical protein [Chlamydiota bacterium]